MKIIFFGSSDFSIPSLKACHESSHEVALVITTPSKKKGRGLKKSETVVAEYCNNHNIPCEMPERPKTSSVIEEIKKLQPDVFVSSSYGKLIPSAWLDIPKRACFNIHPSLLPRHRGAAPLNWTIINGESETGLSVAKITDELDAGDLYYQSMTKLNDHVSSEELLWQLADESSSAILKCLIQLEKNNLRATPQKPGEFTYARKLTKEDGKIDFELSARELHNRIRGLKPWPCAYFLDSKGLLAVLKSEYLDTCDSSFAVGSIIMIEKNGNVTVKTKRGALVLLEVRPSGKRIMTAADYIRGRRLNVGDQLLMT